MNTLPSASSAPFSGLVRTMITRNIPTWCYLFLSGAMINLITLFTALYSMQVYDRVLPRQGIATLIVLTTGVVICYALQWVMMKLRHYLTHQLIKRTDEHITGVVYRQLINTRSDQFPASKGTLASQLQGHESLRQFITSAMSFGLVDAPFAVLFILFLWLIGGPVIAVIPVIILLILLPYGLLQNRRLRHLSRAKFTATHRKQGFLLETVRNIDLIKTANLKASMTSQWEELARQTQDGELRSRHITEATSAMVQLFQQLGYVCIVATGATLAATATGADHISSGVILACSILSGKVLAPIASIPMLLIQAAQVNISTDFLNRFFTLRKDNDLTENPIKPASLTWTWRIEHLEHNFPGRPTPLSVERLVIAEGSRTGIIGAVGCGKSTLLHLLAGLYPPTKGHVYLDDLDIQHIDRTLLARGVAYLPQQPALFAGTLRQNLVLHAPDLSDQAIISMSKRTGLISLIQNNPAGLDLPVGEDGGGLSGGQRQLIALTACLLSTKPVMLLDEPLSSLDPHTEQRIMMLLKELLDENVITTLLLVTHKMSNLALVNTLLVVSPEGNIIGGEKQQILDLLSGSPSA